MNTVLEWTNNENKVETVVGGMKVDNNVYCYCEGAYSTKVTKQIFTDKFHETNSLLNNDYRLLRVIKKVDTFRNLGGSSTIN